MKIICIGRNYAEHAKEMKSAVPTEPVFFMKPDTALLKNEDSFYLPDFSKEVHHEVEVVVKISRNGRHIEEKFANKYYEEVSVGIDFTARDIQQQCKEKGLPWEKAKAFDGSAPFGSFIKKTSADLNQLDFHLEIDGKTVQRGNTRDMIFSIDKIIAYISKFITLKTGDLIFTGTPEGVGAVRAGDRLEAFIGNQPLLRLQVK